MCVCMHKYVCTYMYVFMKRPEFHVSCLPLSYVSVTQSRKGRRAHRCCLCTWARLQVSPLPPHWATDLPTVLKTPFYWWNHPPLQPHPVFLLATALSCSMLRTSSQVNFSVGILISQFILTLFAQSMDLKFRREKSMVYPSPPMSLFPSVNSSKALHFDSWKFP